MKTSRTLKLFTVVIFCTLLAVLPASAQATDSFIPGFYTEWEQSPESGDIGGVEVFVFKGYHGTYVVFSLAEGEPREPILLKAKLDGKKISFKAGETLYEGQFTSKGLKLKDGGFERILRKGSLINWSRLKFIKPWKI